VLSSKAKASSNRVSQRALHLLRQNFLQHLSLPRHQFKLNTALKEIVPEEDRDAIWKACYRRCQDRFRRVESIL
jgi:hypothetical protein